MLARLAILGNARLEFTSTASNDENSTVGLGGTSDHVLDEVTMTRGVNDLGSQISDPNRDNGVLIAHTVTMNLGVSNFQRAISIVIPRSRSAFSLSSTQARIEWEHQPSVLRANINP
jgi:hypothetical protein